MKAHQLEPNHVKYLTNAANAYRQLNDIPQAESLLKQ